MAELNSIDIKFKPLHINNDNVDAVETDQPKTISEEDVIVTEKLIDHLNLIKEYNDRLDAIDYLSANAAVLAGNPTYTTTDQKLIDNIKDLGGSGGAVDFILFQKAVDVVIAGFQNMALTAITGANND